MRTRLLQRGLLTAMFLAFFCITGFAQEPAAAPPADAPAAAAAATPAPAPPNSGDMAWILVSAALVLMMTAPGLAMFYGGLVRKKNVLGVFMQCLFLMGLMTIVWALWGYSFAFGGASPYFGNFDHILLKGVIASAEDSNPMREGLTTIPALLFAVYQGMFFIITPALICGAFAERMKFSTMCVFMVLWGTFVYCPVAHWVWDSDGWLAAGKPYWALDFAGGAVVHITSGYSALICALLLGKRLGFGQEPMPPHNLTYTVLGAALLWVGWFGFNAGSELAADSVAINAFAATHFAAAAGLLAWSACEWIMRGHPSTLGASSGAVAGLVCITPAAGFVTPIAGIFLGLAAGVVCYIACTTLKNAFKYDDSLDAFGVHGIGGTLGAILTGVFAAKYVNSLGNDGLLLGNSRQVINQIVGAGASIAIAVVGTVIILKILDATMGLRVSQEDEIQGLDLSQHGEEGYIFH
jgi:ammonium transporter, Amt family